MGRLSCRLGRSLFHLLSIVIALDDSGYVFDIVIPQADHVVEEFELPFHDPILLREEVIGLL